MTLDLGANPIDDLPLVELDATAQAELVRSGRVTPEELLDAAITRIKRLNPALNALSASAFEAARERARKNAGDGSFAGVPTLLKDLLAYPGQPLGLGSRLMSGQIAPAGSPYTEALDAAGLVVLGKTTTSEFGLVGTTEPLLTGKTRNSICPDRQAVPQVVPQPRSPPAWYPSHTPPMAAALSAVPPRFVAPLDSSRPAGARAPPVFPRICRLPQF